MYTIRGRTSFTRTRYRKRRANSSAKPSCLDRPPPDTRARWISFLVCVHRRRHRTCTRSEGGRRSREPGTGSVARTAQRNHHALTDLRPIRVLAGYRFSFAFTVEDIVHVHDPRADVVHANPVQEASREQLSETITP